MKNKDVKPKMDLWDRANLYMSTLQLIATEHVRTKEGIALQKMAKKALAVTKGTR